MAAQSRVRGGIEGWTWMWGGEFDVWNEGEEV